MEISKKSKILWGFLFFILFILLAFSLFLVFPFRGKYMKKRLEVNALKRELDRKTGMCAELNREVSGLENDPDTVEKVAREKFNLCRENELILKYDKSDE